MNSRSESGIAMEQVAEHENSSTYSRIKEWIFETIQPEMSRSAKTTVFNIIVLALIFVSVGIVFAATFNLPQATVEILKKVEFWIVIVFTVEYALRIWTANLLYPEKNWFMARVCYVFSFMAIIDLLAIFPFYIPFVLPKEMISLRALRALRFLRMFKLNRHFKTLAILDSVIREKAKDLLVVFIYMVLIVMFLSVVVYSVEHDVQPDKFDTVYAALWWAVETFTKAGTRGVYPITTLGRVIGVIVAVLGICLFALPTGIIVSGLNEHLKRDGVEDGQTKKSDTVEHSVPCQGRHDSSE